MSALLQADRLSRVYRAGSRAAVTALRDATFTAEAGELVFILGPSGSGKSTLLHLLGALDRPTSGTVQVAGQDLATLGDWEASALRRDLVGMVFQSHHLLPGLTALENVLVSRVPVGITRQHRARARQLLGDMGLEDRLHHSPGALSGGECQRVAIARALLGDPRIVLADEPTGELDSATGGRVMEVIRALARDQGRTCICVTHDTRVIQKGDRVLELTDGILSAGAQP